MPDDQKQGRPAHHITITPTEGRVVVTLGGQVVADSTRALTLREGSMRPVQYIPREDVAPDVLEPSTHTSHCPFKGDASYFSVVAGDRRAADAVWTYETPFPAVAAIAGHLAFYPDRVDAITITPAA
jgi:uncharacterized protein (DUF427 family)